jgi:hypothetical protein
MTGTRDDRRGGPDGPAEFVEDRVIDLLYPPASALPKAPAPGWARWRSSPALWRRRRTAPSPTGRRLCIKEAAA